MPCRDATIVKTLAALFLAALLAAPVRATLAASATVAVAANFTAPMERLAARFAHDTGHTLRLSYGSTGKFYSQIQNGAPFDVLLAADADAPRRLEREGLAVAGSGFTYALGKLALWSARPGFVDARGEVLKRGGFARLAIANPQLAPYGAAARQALTRFGVWTRLEPKLVMGENIAQTWQFVATGNAELGFVALSQLEGPGAAPRGSRWLVPQELYAPIRQDAVLLARGRGNPAAAALLAFLKGDAARAVIRDFGYALP